MYRYIGMLLTTKKDVNNNIFDKSVIEQLLKDQSSVPVKINFTGGPIGRTTRFFTDGLPDVLKVEFDVNIPHLHELKAYVVPGGYCYTRDLLTEPDGVRRITKYTITEVSITSSPAYPNLPPFTTLNMEEAFDEQAL